MLLKNVDSNDFFFFVIATANPSRYYYLNELKFQHTNRIKESEWIKRIYNLDNDHT